MAALLYIRENLSFSCLFAVINFDRGSMVCSVCRFPPQTQRGITNSWLPRGKSMKLGHPAPQGGPGKSGGVISLIES